MGDQQQPDVEARPGQVIAYFPSSATAAFLSASQARAWASALLAVADAADLLASIEKIEANPRT